MKLDRYIGIPFEEGGLAPPRWDCYGCTRYILAVHAGIFIEDDPAQLDRSQWEQVEGEPRRFDIAEMLGLYKANGKTRIGPVHAGLFISRTHILHCQRVTGTVCVPVERLNLPVKTVWRHRSRA